jgi:uncharacterized repeat protein (TIGR03803 family)
MLKHPVLSLTASALLAFLAFAAPAAYPQTYNVLYSFGTGPHDPGNPGAVTLAQGRDGNLYGTTFLGGDTFDGTIFQITPTGDFTVIHSINQSDGVEPIAGLTLTADGNFLGSTPVYGPGGYGTAFKVRPTGTLKVLYAFTNSSDGSYPSAGPIPATDGAYYGTTSAALSDELGYGTVYKLTPSGKLTTLHQFLSTDGDTPEAPLVQAQDGSFYGTTLLGGANGVGSVFRVTRTGGFTLLHSFDCPSGCLPMTAPLIEVSNGVFYGVTSQGGTNGYGVLFKLAANGNFAVVHNFDSALDGGIPGGIMLAPDGDVYGVTAAGGSTGYGTFFRITPAGDFSVLYAFDEGLYQQAPPYLHTNGLFYGTSPNAGADNRGLIYSLDVGIIPFARLVSTSGLTTSTIGILGQGFTATSSVDFAGTSAVFTASSDTYLEAIVPDDALTGQVTVTTATGNLASNQAFRVTPSILSFDPPSGAVGTPVIITGKSLAQTTAVRFGNVLVTSFTVDSNSQVTAIVPAGAQTGNIVIRTAGGTAQSPGSFVVTQ